MERSEYPLMMPAGRAAEYLGMSRSTLVRETKRGRIRCKKVGVQYWYARVALDNYVALEVDLGDSQAQDVARWPRSV